MIQKMIYLFDMISKKIDLTLRPIYNLFKIDKTILSGSVRREVKTSLIASDIALRRVYKAYEENNRLDEPLAQIVKAGIEGIADLEFFNVAVSDEVENLRDYSNKLKEQNEELRERIYQLSIENQQLKF